MKKTQLAMIKSYFVLNAAVRKPGIASLPILQGQADATDWLERHLEVRYPEDAEILEISLRGPEAYATDLVRIVDAVANAYSDEVLFKERSRTLSSRDIFARSLESLNKKIADKSEVYLDIAKESDAPDEASDAALRQKALQAELDQLQRVADEMAAKLLRMEIEANAPQRIELIQKAVASPDD